MSLLLSLIIQDDNEKEITDFGLIVDENDFFEQMSGRSIDDTVDTTKNWRPSFVFEYENDTSCWQVVGIFNISTSIFHQIRRNEFLYLKKMINYK